MASDNASFHAKITADASGFVAEMQAAAAALATLVKQAETAGKVKSTANKSNASAAANEIKAVAQAARAESDKTTDNAIENIKKENAARSSGGGGRATASKDFFQPQAPRSAALGPVRDGQVGALDQKRLQDTYKFTKQLTEAERTRAAQNKMHGQAIREDMARTKQMNKAYYAAVLEDRRRTEQAQRRELDAMVTGRYALYDLSSTYETAARSALRFLQAIGGVVTTSAQFESSFTSVERALQPTGTELEKIKDQLIGLTQVMPLAFGDITQIATLGAQMGVTANGIEAFTQNVASFSAVTGASIDETAQRFGRIAALAGVATTDFNKLGSAVAYTGINAVATEQEILALTESIAAATKNVGYSAAEIVGFATTLSSLGIAPEQARGVVLRVFADITRAVETGGEELEAFGKIAGVSGKQAAEMWKSTPEKYFSLLLDGLGTVDNFTKAMDSLGFTETRETNVLQRLAQNRDIYNQSMQDSNTSFEEGTFLADSYAKTADNLDSRIIALKNSFQVLADAAGSDTVKALSEFVKFLSGAVNNMAAFAKTDIGRFILPTIAIIGGLVLAFTAMTAASYRATAQLFALRTAMIELGKTNGSMKGSVRNLVSSLLGFQQEIKMSNGQIKLMTKSEAMAVDQKERLAGRTTGLTNATQQYTTAAKAAGIASRAMGIAMSAVGVIGIVTTLTSIVGTFIETRKAAVDLTNGFSGLREALAADYSSSIQEFGSDTAVSAAIASGALVGVTTEAQSASEELDKVREAAGNMARVTGTDVPSSVDSATDSLVRQNIVLGENYNAWVQSALMQSETFQNIVKNDDFNQYIEDTGFSFDAANEAAKKGKKELEAYFKGLEDVAKASGDYRTGFGDIFKENARDLKAIPTYLMDQFGDMLLGSANSAKVFAYSMDDASLVGKTALDMLAKSFQETSGTAADLKAVMPKIKKAVLDLDAVTDPDLRVKINDVESIAAMRRILEAQRALIMGMAGKVTGGADMVRLNAQLASITAAEKSLNGFVSTTTSGLDKVGSAAESAADKLARLADAANSGLKANISLQNSLRSLGSAMKETASWSSKTEKGSAKLSAVMGTASEIIGRAAGNSKKAARDLNIFKLVLKDMGAPAAILKIVDNYIKAIGESAKLTKKQIAALRKQFPATFADFTTGITTGIEEVEKKFYSLTDYVNDLKGVLQSAFDIRYGKEAAYDDITSGWMDIADAAQSAKDAIKEANDEINSSLADRSVLEYQLTVAERYGDTERAAIIRAKLAELDTKIAEKRKDVAEATDAASMALTGDSKAAIENRSKIRALVQTYNSYLASLANTGMSTEDLKAEAEKLSKEFLTQGTNMGFAEADLMSYTNAFRSDFTNVINNLPKDITVEANTDPALRAIQEFVREANAALEQIQQPTIDAPVADPNAGGGNGGSSNGGGTPAATVPQWVTETKAQIKALNTTITKTKKQLADIDAKIKSVTTQYNAIKYVPGMSTVADSLKAQLGDLGQSKRMTSEALAFYTGQVNTLKSKLTAGGYARGGYVNGMGTANSDSIPAMLSNGEFVVRAAAVNKYGPDFMNALNNQRMSIMPVGNTNSGGSSSSSGVVYLSPDDRALLRQAINRPIALYTENTTIAKSANAGNVILAQRGER